MTWYYKSGDREVGPISKAELADYVRIGRVDGKTLVRHVGMGQWRPLAQMVHGEHDHRQDGAPPVPPSAPPETAKPMPGNPPPSNDAVVPFQFKGAGGEYFKIWIVNVLLSIVTLGIYSAWAKVRRKQYFYSNTHVAGSAFRYLANPIKILKGRAVVFGGFVVYTLAGEFFPPVGFIVLIGFILVLPWLVVRSLVFNARNSSLRNIRFNFNGSYGEAAKVYLLFPALIPFTLGILVPFVLYRQKKFIVENSTYGTTPFSFHATARDYYRIFFAFLVPFTVALAIALFIGFGASQAWYAFSHAGAAIGLFLAIIYFYAFAFFSVKTSNLLFNSGALLRHRFRATMKVPAYGFILLTNTLATVLTLGLFHPFAKVRAYAYKIRELALLPGGDLEQFVAAESREVSALGDEIADFMDFDFGI